MNIFVLDLETRRCAQYHNDRHCSKMILESAQLLSTTVRCLGFDVGYKTTHLNHPCSRWLRESFRNFDWLCCLIADLNQEFVFRFGKDHKSFLMVRDLIFPLKDQIKEKFSLHGLLVEKLTCFAQAMPDHLRSDDAVSSYRRYYIAEKQHLAKWTKRNQPEWWKE